MFLFKKHRQRSQTPSFLGFHRGFHRGFHWASIGVPNTDNAHKRRVFSASIGASIGYQNTSIGNQLALATDADAEYILRHRRHTALPHSHMRMRETARRMFSSHGHTTNHRKTQLPRGGGLWGKCGADRTPRRAHSVNSFPLRAKTKATRLRMSWTALPTSRCGKPKAVFRRSARNSACVSRLPLGKDASCARIRTLSL